MADDLSVDLASCHLKVTDEGVPWVVAHRQLLQDSELRLSQFLPPARVEPGKLLFEGMADSVPAGRLISRGAIREFGEAVDQLERLREDRAVVEDNRHLLRRFSFPNPRLKRTGPPVCRLCGGELKLLWGFEPADAGEAAGQPPSISPRQMHDYLRRRSCPPAWSARTYGLLGAAACLLIALAAWGSWWYVTHWPPELLDARVEGASVIRVAFNEPVTVPEAGLDRHFAFDEGRREVVNVVAVPDDPAAIRLQIDPRFADGETDRLSVHAIADRQGHRSGQLTSPELTYLDRAKPTATYSGERAGVLRFSIDKPLDADSVAEATATIRSRPDGGRVGRVGLVMAEHGTRLVRTQGPVSGLEHGAWYDVEFSGLRDDSVTGNPVGACEFQFHDETPPTVVEAAYRDDGVHLALSFSEPVRGGDLARAVRITGAPVQVHSAHTRAGGAGAVLLTDQVAGVAGRQLNVQVPAGALADRAGNRTTQIQAVSVGVGHVREAPVGSIAAAYRIEDFEQGLDASTGHYFTRLNAARIAAQAPGGLAPYPPVRIKRIEIVYGQSQADAPRVCFQPHLDADDPNRITAQHIELTSAVRGGCVYEPVNGDAANQLRFNLRFPTWFEPHQWRRIRIVTASHGHAELPPPPEGQVQVVEATGKQAPAMPLSDVDPATMLRPRRDDRPADSNDPNDPNDPNAADPRPR